MNDNKDIIEYYYNTYEQIYKKDSKGTYYYNMIGKEWLKSYRMPEEIGKFKRISEEIALLCVLEQEVGLDAAI